MYSSVFDIKRLAGRNWFISLRESEASGLAFGSPVHFHDAGAVVGGKGPVALASERLLRALLAQGQRRGGASAASEKFWDRLRSEDGVAKTSSSLDKSKSKLANRAA